MRRSSPPHAIEVAAAAAVDQAAGPEEQQPLEQGVVPEVQQGAGQGQGRGPVFPPGAGDQGKTESEDHQSDVLHRRVGQAALDVPLQQRQRDAVQGAEAAEQYQPPAPPGRGGWEPAEHPQQAVEADLHHHRRQQRRDVAGRGRMGIGQPDVEGEETGLDPEPAQCQQKQAGGRRGGELGQGAEVAKIQAGAPGSGLQKQRQQHHQTAMGEHQIEPGGPPHLGQAVIPGHQKKGTDRHQFPGREEQHRVGRGHHQQQRRHQQIEKKPVAAKGTVRGGMPQIRAGVEGTQGGEQADRQQEKSRQRVEAKHEAATGDRPGSAHTLGSSAEQHRQRRPKAAQPAQSDAQGAQSAGKLSAAAGGEGRQGTTEQNQPRRQQRGHTPCSPSPGGKYPQRSSGKSWRWRRRQSK